MESMSSSGQRWKIDEKDFEKVKELIKSYGATEDDTSNNSTETWRLRIGKSVFTLYSSGTLYNNQATSQEVLELKDKLSGFSTSEFKNTGYELLMGLDETGKGEVIGHEVLCGALFPSILIKEIKETIGVADTKTHHMFEYWDDLFSKIDPFLGKGLVFFTQTIPPWHIDKYNINKIMDIVYRRIISDITRNIPLEKTSIVVDNYQIGDNLNLFLKNLSAKGAKVIIEAQADDKYLEAKLASILAKREREKIMKGINEHFKIEGLEVGSGNTSDIKTRKWLEAWKKSNQPWPWIVKQSFSTIRKLDNKKGKATKVDPPIRQELLTKKSRSLFEEGKLSTENLLISCPECASELKAVMITMSKSSKYDGRCPSCKKEIQDLKTTLQYYNGTIIPDTSAIITGIFSKDLLNGGKFFEGFTVLLDPRVVDECDNEGGRAELGRLGEIAAIGRIRLLYLPAVESYEAKTDDEVIIAAEKNNAIILTADMGQYVKGVGKNLFAIALKF